jgi:hypothetical protein
MVTSFGPVNFSIAIVHQLHGGDSFHTFGLLDLILHADQIIPNLLRLPPNWQMGHRLKDYSLGGGAPLTIVVFVAQALEVVSGVHKVL